MSVLHDLFHEFSQLKRFLASATKTWRQLIIYAESACYNQCFEEIVQSLIDHHDIHLCYVTTDEKDPVFRKNDDHIRAFLFKKLLPFALSLADTKVILMTTPDLGNFHIKRSLRGAHHVYLFHSAISTHMGYRPKAFDHYDTIFCVGPHHFEEIRATEKLYDLPPKNLEKIGYSWLESIYRDHQNYLNDVSQSHERKKLVLIAPSWGDGNIIESCVKELAGVIHRAGYRVIVRPHPETLKRKPTLMRELREHFEQIGETVLETDLVNHRSIHEADLLVTDWSGIALEYAFGTERPVLFVDVPCKVNNPDYHRLDLEPLEVHIREKIGRVIAPQEVPKAAETAALLLQDRELYRKGIRSLREQYVYHFGESARRGAAYIAGLVKSSS